MATPLIHTVVPIARMVTTVTVQLPPGNQTLPNSIPVVGLIFRGPRTIGKIPAQTEQHGKGGNWRQFHRFTTCGGKGQKLQLQVQNFIIVEQRDLYNPIDHW